RPGKRERCREPEPAETAPDEPEPDHAQEIEGNRREVRGWEIVPLSTPTADEVAGDVGLVRDRPVRVALRVRRLAASVRLDAVPDFARVVGRPTGLEVP